MQAAQIRLKFRCLHTSRFLVSVRFFFSLFFASFWIVGWAQADTKFTFSGRIKDGTSGEDLINASVGVPALKTGAYTNSYGFFSLTLPAGTYVVQISFPGLQTLTDTLDLTKDIQRTYELPGLETEAIVVEGEGNAFIDDVGMGKERLDINTIKAIPMLFGETDLIRAVQLLPGVQFSSDGGSGFNVRGGGIDQNLILLDEATVYNPSHLLGFFSVFNSDAIKDVELYKGGIPAKYGGRLSSVLDVHMREGNRKDFSFRGGLGVIASRLTLEGPIVKDKGSWIVSGRRTYLDVFLPLSRNEDVQNNTLNFFDLNAKANYDFGEKDRLFVSAYYGRDRIGFADFFGFNWGNATATARWNHLFSDKHFSNLTALYTNFNYAIEFENNNNPAQSASIENVLQNYSLKWDLSVYPNARHNINYGVQSTLHSIDPGQFIPGADSSIFRELNLERQYGVETAAYIDHKWDISDVVSIRYGLRMSHFAALGPRDVYQYPGNDPTFVDPETNETAEPIDTTRVGKGRLIRQYFNPEPRLGIRFKINSRHAIKVSYDRTAQYIHLMNNSASSLPTDQWLPSGEYIQPQRMDQVAVGYFTNFWQGKLEFSVEGYYKWLQNQVDFKDWAELVFNETIETEIRRGTGRAYGVEFMVKKTVGNWSGWLSYTYARVFNTIPGINEGEEYRATNDRPHYVTAVINWEPHPRWQVGGTFVLFQNTPFTLPSGQYTFNGNTVPYYTERNSYRMPLYHRLDLSATFKLNKLNSTKRFQHSLNLSLFNAYSRKNAWAIQIRQSEDDPTQQEAVKLYLFPVIPSVTWNFEF